MRQRKTFDEFDLITDYGYGPEVECTEDSFKEAKQRKKEYLENAQGLISIEIKKRRVKIIEDLGKKDKLTMSELSLFVETNELLKKGL
jgi:hypothetical protein